MSLYSYETQCAMHIEEIKELLTYNDIKWLQAYLEENGLTPFLEWVSANFQEISSFLMGTPKQRERKKKWKEAPYRIFLSYAALLSANYAYNQLRIAGQIVGSADSGMSYRQMTSYVGMDMLRPPLFDVCLWPFEECPPPDIEGTIKFR